MRLSLPRVAWLLGVAAACSQGAEPTLPPAGQIVLHFDTDAPLPDAEPGAPPPLFDRLRVTLLPPDPAAACDGCTQEFELSTPQLANSPGASIGILFPTGQSGWMAHVQMFPRAFATTGDPDPRTTVDVTVALPAVAATGVLDVTVMLSTSTVGQPVGTVSSPGTPVPGAPTASLVGTWAPATVVPCKGTATKGEVCIPGGAYWMGTSLAPNPPLPFLAYLHPTLVVVSPFFLGAAEVTVAEFRAFHEASVRWSGGTLGTSSLDWCTFDSNPGVTDDYPFNCVRWTEARAYCRARGADLPTEAQWEYAASGLAGKTFVWGSDLPGCSDAVWGRAGEGFFGNFQHACTPASPGEAPLPLPSTGRGLDALVLDGGTVYDLAGDLAEWTLDEWDSPDGPCWSAAHVYTDPRCGGDNPFYGAVRGGSWYEAANVMLAVARTRELTGSFAVADGFRCARADTP